MGCGTENSSQRQSSEGTSRTTFAPASEQEKQLLANYNQLGDAQKKTLMGLMEKANGSGSMFTMTPEDQAQLDAAYTSARGQLETGMRDYADFNAGGRGLRMSDTPVAQQALQRYGLGLAELQSQKANAGLNLGFQANQARNALGLNTVNSLPAGYNAAFTPLFNERMASGTTHFAGSGSSRSTYNPSILGQINQGMQAYYTLGAGTNQFAQAASSGAGSFAMSDINLKRDITPFAWKWKDGDEKEYLGVIAQDVERSHPHLVSRDQDGNMLVNYGAMTAMLLREREELYAQLEQERSTRTH